MRVTVYTKHQLTLQSPTDFSAFGRMGGGRNYYGQITNADITKLRPHRSIQTNTTSSETFKQVCMHSVSCFDSFFPFLFQAHLTLPNVPSRHTCGCPNRQSLYLPRAPLLRAIPIIGVCACPHPFFLNVYPSARVAIDQCLSLRFSCCLASRIHAAVCKCGCCFMRLCSSEFAHHRL